MTSLMNRGAVWWVTFDSSRDGEIQKSRPAIIVSNDAFNRHLNRVQVVPITSNVSKIYSGEALINVNNKQHKAMANQLTTATKERLLEIFGKISALDISKVENAIKVQLALE